MYHIYDRNKALLLKDKTSLLDVTMFLKIQSEKTSLLHTLHISNNEWQCEGTKVIAYLNLMHLEAKHEGVNYAKIELDHS